MAYLITADSRQENVYLRPYHSFGRLAGKVDTVLQGLETSKLHAVIEWLDDIWYIRDISTNGVWLNHKKINTNIHYQLHPDDRIYLGDPEKCCYQVCDLNAPTCLLQPLADQILVKTTAITLQKYNLFPSEAAPEIALFYDEDQQGWLVEDLAFASLSPVADGEKIKFSETYWRLISPLCSLPALTQRINTSPKNGLVFIFNLSQDEETTELKLRTADEFIDFSARSHHYLSAYLARARDKDIRKKVGDDEQGWLDTTRVARDLGVDIYHLNILIHRARKQLVNNVRLDLPAEWLIERKRGKVRFGSPQFIINKANTLISLPLVGWVN